MTNKKDSIDFMERIQRSDSWHHTQRAALEEAFEFPSLRAALKEVLLTSDAMLKNIGMTDFTDPTAIQNGLRAQGTARGLVEAVELICEKLATYDEPTEEKNND